MGFQARRRLDLILLLGAALVAAGLAAIVAAAGDTERIGPYWTSATVTAGGPASVVEVIDYDFGSSSRHGIFRDIPGLDPASPIAVDSTTAPDQFVVLDGDIPRIRIGDPDRTVSGRHRYRIDYEIGLVFDGQIRWNAVGTEWPVGIGEVEAHLLADRALTDLGCSQGPFGAWGGCDVTQVEPGHLVVVVDGLDSAEGVTITATPTGDPIAVPTGPTPPAGEAPDDGTGSWPAAVAAGAGALVAGLLASVVVRRQGRELVWAGGSADAAFGPQFDERYPTRLVDHAELAGLASTEFAPPKGLTAWQGGVLYREHANTDHRVAWLLERAIAGEIELEGGADDDDDLAMRRLPVDSSDAEPTLRALFGGRQRVDLGEYDKQFAAGWDVLGSKLDSWHRDSEYWDPSGDRRQRRTRVVGGVLVVLGLAALIAFAVVANRVGAPFLVGVAAGGLLAGAGFSMLLRSWELRIRTPEGSGLWILIESFRRFIHNSDAQHVEAAAKQGVLLDYTAWAVALGEVDRWSEAIDGADIDDGVIAPQAMYMAALAPRLGAAASTASSAPSSSGSGGGGGGFSGGGGGGGGGGSW